MGLPKGMQHVSREELYTSLPTRIQYLQSFLEFDADDVQALVEGQKYIKAVIPAIVNIVYKKLLKYDITAKVFTTRDTRSEETIEQFVTEDSAQIQHRKMFLRWYLTKLNSDPTKMEYWEYLDKVGLMHVGLGRRNPLHVDYIFLGSCLGFIQDSMFEAILCHPHLDISKKIAIVKALGKIIWIQNDLFAKWHCTDGKEYTDDVEVDISSEGEKEGYIHGKRVLGGNGTGSESDGDGASVATSVSSSASGKASSIGRIREEVEMRQQGSSGASSSRCPFSGMTTASPMEGQRAQVTANRTRTDSNNTPRAASPHSRSNSEDDLLKSSQQQGQQEQQSPPLSPSTKRESMIPRLHVQNGKIVGKEQVLEKNGNIFEL